MHLSLNKKNKIIIKKAKMADKPPTLPPATGPFPGSRTPGWNDPPTLQYNPLTAPVAASGRPKLNLNKRIAFPLQGMGGAAGTTTASSKPTAIVQPNQTVLTPPLNALPPSSTQVSGSNQPIAVVHPMPNMNLPQASARVPPPTGCSLTEGNQRTLGTIVALPNDAHEHTLRILREQTGQVQESLNVRREEIERRLGLIEQLWQSGNLTTTVQLKIYQLAKDVADKKFKEAMDTYTSLVMNNSNDCTTWAVALRHIVLTLQPVTDAADTDFTTTTTTTTLIENNTFGAAAVPAMFVPAMPRAAMASATTNISNDTATPAHAYAEANGNGATHSAVQHI